MIKINTYIPGFAYKFAIEQSINELFVLIQHAELGQQIELFEMMAKSLSQKSESNEILKVRLNQIKKEL